MSSALKKSENSQVPYSFDLPENSPMLAKDFTFGVATSSFQIEGATNADGRIASIWDTFCATQGKVMDGDNGDMACDHYNLWENDIDLLAELGVDAYRFSLSWVRLLKQDGTINTKGFDFYKKILEKLNKLSIQPYATLYHWDLPQYIEDRGGWLNRDCAYRFQDYADIVSREIGDQVTSFATLNEPWCAAFLGYGFGVHAPGITGARNAKQAGHHMLLAHGLGMQALRTNAPEKKNGIVLNLAPMTPQTDSYEDAIVSKMAEAGGNHWFLEPLLKGSYPDIVNHFHPTEAPLVLNGDMEVISTPMDFVGVNYYTHNIAAYDQGGELKMVKKEGAEHTDFGWEIYPQGLTDLLVDLNKQYDFPELLITENGSSGTVEAINGEVHDEQRCRYFDLHLNAVNDAIAQGVNVTGYFAWSFLDNFEWAEGYSKRFGLFHVDFDTQERIAKSSAKAFQNLLTRRV